MKGPYHRAMCVIQNYIIKVLIEKLILDLGLLKYFFHNIAVEELTLEM